LRNRLALQEMPFSNINIKIFLTLGRKKLHFDPTSTTLQNHTSATLQNRLAFREMPFFDKNIKIYVKKCLEEKSFVLTQRV
jgi:hypothetical protein